MYTIARTKLKLSDEEFWDSDIDKINAMIEAHNAMMDEKLAKQREVSAVNESGETPIDMVDFL